MSKDIFTKKYLQRISQKNSLANKTWKKHIIQAKTLKRKYVPKIFEEKSRLHIYKYILYIYIPKNLWREIRIENLRRVISVQTNFEEKFLRKQFWRESVYQEVLKKSLPKNIWQRSLPKNP